MPAPPFAVTTKLTQAFFDRQAVIDRVEKARRKNLSKAGAFVRTRARSLLRKKSKKNRKPSPPGKPPTLFVTWKFRSLKWILFGYDATVDGVIVGPVGFKPTQNASAPRDVGDVPGTLEHGGQLPILERLVNGRWRGADNRLNSQKGMPERVRMAHYPPRPFMQLALALESKTTADVWKDSV